MMLNQSLILITAMTGKRAGIKHDTSILALISAASGYHACRSISWRTRTLPGPNESRLWCIRGTCSPSVRHNRDAYAVMRKGSGGRAGPLVPSFYAQLFPC